MTLFARILQRCVRWVSYFVIPTMNSYVLIVFYKSIIRMMVVDLFINIILDLYLECNR